MKRLLKLGILLAVFAMTSSAWATLTAVGGPNGSRNWSPGFTAFGSGFDRVEILWISGSYLAGQSGFDVGGWSETTSNQFQSIATGPATTVLNWTISFENSNAEPVTFLYKSWSGSTLLDQELAAWDGNSWTMSDLPNCDLPNPVTVDMRDDICQCIEACAGVPLIVYFSPLSQDQRPSEIRIADGCTGDPFREAETMPGYGCDYTPDCPPAYPHPWDGNSFYNAAMGGWGIVVEPTANGCFCICIDDYLPVELIGFDAIAGDESVSLSWTTASEVDNDRFEIMRDAVTMTAIDANNYAAGSHYTWTDNYNLTNGREYNYSLVAVSMDGVRETIGTVNATPTMSAATITEYALHQNYPNPFNPETNIIFDIVDEGAVKLTVYNPLGQTVATLVNGTVQAGRHTVTFDAASLPSGLYYYHLEAGDFNAVKKMILMK